MGSVDDDSVGACLHQSIHTIHHIGGDTHASGHAETTILVLAGVRTFLGLHDITVGNEAHELAFLVHNGQFFDFMLLQNIGSLGESSAYMGGDELSNHYLAQRTLHVALETQVTIRHHADKHLILVHDRDAANTVFLHQAQGILHLSILVEGHGIDNHTVLGTLHFSYLVGLTFDAHILVEHTNTTFLGHTDGHSGLGDCVHCRRNQRGVESDALGEARRYRDLAGQHFRIGGDEQDVVVSKAFADEFRGVCIHNIAFLSMKIICKNTTFF